MGKINPKLIDEIFTDDVLDVLPSNDKLKYTSAALERSVNPNIKKNQLEGIKKKQNTLEYQNNFDQGMKKRQQSIDWKSNMLGGCIKRSTTQWKENQKKAIKQKLSKPVSTPYGIFASVTEVVNFLLAKNISNANKKVYKWLKESNSGYQYITREEYIILTGRDVV